MSNLVWSWLLTILGVTSLYLAGSKHKAGWLMAIFCQALWIVYGVSTEQYGFAAGGVCYGAVFIRNEYRARRFGR